MSVYLYLDLNAAICQTHWRTSPEIKHAMKMKNISTLFRSVFQISVTRIGLYVTFVYPVDGNEQKG